MRTVAKKEFIDNDTGVSALCLQQIDDKVKKYNCFYAVFDNARVSGGFKTLEDLERFLKNSGFEEV